MRAHEAPWYSSSTMKTEATADPATHSSNIQQELEGLIRHVREDVERVNEPRFEALLETTAEVLGGLKTAYQHYSEKSERAWGGSGAVRA